jgi:hypothetical protein
MAAALAGAGNQETELVLSPQAKAGEAAIMALGLWHDAWCRRPGAVSLRDASEQLAQAWVDLGRACDALETAP